MNNGKIMVLDRKALLAYVRAHEEPKEMFLGLMS